jgi:trigger factor
VKENRDRVIDAMLTSVTFPVPTSLVLREVSEMVKERQTRGQEADTPEMREQMKTVASERVKLGLLMTEIIKQNNISSSEEKIREILAIESEGYDNPEEFIRWYLSDKQRRLQVESLALEHAIVELVFSQAKVTPVVKSINNLVG